MAPVPGGVLSGLDLRRRPVVGVAVSGGSDSLALLDLARAALTPKHYGTRLVAITVDHGLRPEAAKEAQQVGAFCQQLGIEHRIARWQPREGDGGGLIARAREARYELLAGIADEIGTDLVLLGHTRDDQAETLAMRQAREGCGKGWRRGDAGMARAMLFDGRIWFARPLLGATRAALRDHLRKAGIAWIDDPTNEDMRFERVRVRARLGTAERGACIDRLARQADVAAGLRAEMGRLAAGILERSARQVAPGLFQLDPTATAAKHGEEPLLYAFRSLAACVGGTPHLPDRERAAALLKRLEISGGRATLSRTVIERRPDGLYLHRESRGLPRLRAVEAAVWDGRFKILASVPKPAPEISPCGRADTPEWAPPSPQPPRRLIRAALSAEPAIWEGDRFLGLAREHPALRLERLVSPFARFLGEFDLSLAQALSDLIGATPPPVSPWADHNPA